MNQRNTRAYGKILTIGLLAVMIWTLINKNPIFFIATLFFGMIILYSYKSRMDEVTEDERVYQISEKASRKTFQFSTMIYAIIGAILLLLGQRGYSELNPIGYTLTFVAGMSTTVYMVFYWYYNKKF